MGETRIDNLKNYAEEVRRLKLAEAVAKTPEEKETISKELWELTKEKVERNLRLDREHKTMHQAAEEAEASGVGTGGKGSPED